MTALVGRRGVVIDLAELEPGYADLTARLNGPLFQVQS